MVDVSIIIVSYNGFELLRECIKSIIETTHDLELEFIVVDNNSAEGDVRDVLNSFNSVKVIQNSDNKGFATANNQGVEEATGKYIAFINNDTFFFENTLNRIFDFAESFNEDILVGCKLLNKDNSYQESIVKFPGLWNDFTENYFLYKLFPQSPRMNKYYQNNIVINEPVEVDVIKGAFMFCSAEAVRKLEGFDSRFFFYSEETDICYRFKKYHNGRIFYYPSTSIIHYGGIVVNSNKWFFYKNLSTGKIQFYQKHFKGFKFLFALGLHYIAIGIRALLYLAIGVLSFKKEWIVKSYFYLKLLGIYPENKF